MSDRIGVDAVPLWRQNWRVIRRGSLPLRRPNVAFAKASRLASDCLVRASRSVQIVWSTRRGSRQIEHLGSDALWRTRARGTH